MTLSVKLIISSKKNLELKYGNKFSSIQQLLTKLVEADKKRNLDTKIVFIDDSVSAKKIGISPVSSITQVSCKKAVDDLYKIHQPEYMVILGAQDVFPFQEITNPANDDDDSVVPSDLPYACNTPYNKKISAFTGPTRVVGRIPDVPGSNDTKYLKTIIENTIKFKPVNANEYLKSFSVTADVWKKSTQMNLQAMFGNSDNLLYSPPVKGNYSTSNLKPLTHFYNCHGVLNEPKYYGQKGANYPTALTSSDLNSKISSGTLVAAECCYGAQLFNPNDTEMHILSIANNYLLNNAVSFLGSSTIAYGPSDSLANADLITQYFIKNVLNGASTGRALLEARQKFLIASGPQLDPYELKTLAQFYLLGDPSIHHIIDADTAQPEKVVGNTIKNRRMNLFNKGLNLKKTIAPSESVKTESSHKHSTELKKLLTQTDFTGKETQSLYAVKSKNKQVSVESKQMSGNNVKFRTFVKPGKKDRIHDIKVLVVKEDNEQLLGWRMYVSK